jgi:23S rRNA (adenine2503-C2)-methyltransferase
MHCVGFRLIEVGPGMRVETVFIPETSKLGTTRGVLCVSSQVGCSLDCSFCFTGVRGCVSPRLSRVVQRCALRVSQRQKLMKNLLPSHILQQLMVARSRLGDFPLKSSNDDSANSITNIVFMGQGEPLYNFR